MPRALRAIRLDRGWSQEELADQAGVDAATIVRLERGRGRRPYPGTRKRIADALGVAVSDVQEFANGEDPASRP